MQLTEAHFTAVAGHLISTLQELQVAQELIDEVAAIAMSTKADVLNLSAEDARTPVPPAS